MLIPGKAARRESRTQSGKFKAEGMIVKKTGILLNGTRRKRGNWWKWKIDPLTIDGVMNYAQ